MVKPEASLLLGRELTEAVLKALIDSAVDAMVVIDHSGKVLMFNPAAARLSGYDADEMLAQNVSKLMPTSEAKQHDGYLRRYAETGERRIIGIGRDVVLQRKDGSQVDVHLSVGEARFRDQSYFVGVLHDISAAKQAEAARLKLIDELSFKNAELERFTYTVSHDLKSPLITIKGFVSMLQEARAAGDDADFETDLQRIAGAADQMTKLLDELLALSRVGRVVRKFEDVDLNGLVTSVIETLSGPLMERGAEVRIEGSLPTVRGDRLRLFEVLQNLIENSIKFMGDQSHPSVSVHAEVRAGRAVIGVVDNGIGLSPEYTERVFGLFEQLDPRLPGTGVGLALVKRIVEAHKGRVWVESEGEGKGARFYVELPHGDDAAAEEETHGR